jgi:hypothetical protein
MSGESIGDYYKNKEKDEKKKRKGKTIDKYLKNIVKKIRENSNEIDAHDKNFGVVEENFIGLDKDIDDLQKTSLNLQQFLEYRIPSTLDNNGEGPGEFSKWVDDSGDAYTGGRKTRKKRRYRKRKTRKKRKSGKKKKSRRKTKRRRKK